MRKAVQRKDHSYVSAHVDFPQLRESLKGTFTAQMAKEVAATDTDGFEAFGAALGAMMIGPMIDALVTPEGLIAMMLGTDPNEVKSRPSPRNTGSASG
jgi:hypothetical protein